MFSAPRHFLKKKQREGAIPLTIYEDNCCVYHAAFGHQNDKIHSRVVESRGLPRRWDKNQQGRADNQCFPAQGVENQTEASVLWAPRASDHPNYLLPRTKQKASVCPTLTVDKYGIVRIPQEVMRNHGEVRQRDLSRLFLRAQTLSIEVWHQAPTEGFFIRIENLLDPGNAGNRLKVQRQYLLLRSS